MINMQQKDTCTVTVDVTSFIIKFKLITKTIYLHMQI